MVAHERSRFDPYMAKLPRWWVSPKRMVEISDGVFLSSCAGNGETPEAALESFKKIIAGRKLKIGNDYYVNCPNEWLED